MPTEDNQIQFLTQDNFLTVLLKGEEHWTPKYVRSQLKPTTALDAFYQGIEEFLVEEGYAQRVEREENNVIGELPLRLGKTLHLNISNLVQEELKDITVSVSIIISVFINQFTGDAIALAGSLATIIPRVIRSATKIKKQLGEVCVLDVIQEFYVRKGQTGATKELIAYKLNLEQCRYPEAKCRFEKEGVCQISEENIEAVLKHLKDEGIIIPITNEEPYEWQIQF